MRKRSRKINHIFHNSIRSLNVLDCFMETLREQAKNNEIELTADERLNLINKFIKRLLR